MESLLCRLSHRIIKTALKFSEILAFFSSTYHTSRFNGDLSSQRSFFVAHAVLHHSFLTGNGPHLMPGADANSSSI